MSMPRSRGGALASSPITPPPRFSLRLISPLRHFFFPHSISFSFRRRFLSTSPFSLFDIIDPARASRCRDFLHFACFIFFLSAIEIFIFWLSLRFGCFHG